jgi:hypothetical protein
MYLLWKVANKTEDMGWKIMKFHGIVHMVDDIFFLFGVPNNVTQKQMKHEAGHNKSST